MKYKKQDFFKIWTGILLLIAPRKNVEQGNKKENTLKSFFALMLSQKFLTFKIFCLSLIVTVIGIVASFYYQVLMDNIIPHSAIEMLNILSIGIIGLSLAQLLIGFLRSLLVIKLEQNLDLSIMLRYYNHILYLPMKFFTMRKTGEIISRFNDASNIREAVSSATLTIMMDTLMAVVGGVILYHANTQLFCIAFTILAAYFAIVFAFRKPIKLINEKVMEQNAQVTSHFVESVNGIEAIKSFSAEDKEQTTTEKLYNKFLKLLKKSGVVFLTQGTVTQFVYAIGGVVILWVGVMNIIENKLTIGELITFNALLAYFLEPMKNLINLQPQIQTAVVAANRLGEVLELACEELYDERSTDTILLSSKLEIKNLYFRYGTRALVLDDISLKIKQGQRVAFVGESGSGKTTLAKLLMRFYDYENGKILLDDTEIKTISLKYLRKKIAYISQETFLFSGTIKDNLLLSNPNATEDELDYVIKAAGITDFIEGLPLKLSTLIHENGKDLSGGQKQRLSIARALLRSPELLIMDEATSNLDTITEKTIKKTINALSKNLTVIVIAHRLSTIKNCDIIYGFDDGKIIENGTHKQLIEQHGTYFNLYEKSLQ
ncbi:bacteriocin cleavage/export ABC transporter [Clostridia bacterium]|nr:bacteriocin cleavage/export ABC transporter [Clostridia bacterium]